jgi:hypothetical protein
MACRFKIILLKILKGNPTMTFIYLFDRVAQLGYFLTSQVTKCEKTSRNKKMSLGKRWLNVG